LIAAGRLHKPVQIRKYNYKFYKSDIKNRGLSDWVRSFADQLAEAGNIAIAPDLLSGFNSEYQRTGNNPNGSDANIASRNASRERLKAILSGL
jgi:dienelactone hydrolase